MYPVPLYMMLRGYYDINGRKEDSEFLTMTGLVASESVWEVFEVKWQEVLQAHGAWSFRMSDVMYLKGEYSRHHGWDDKRVDALLRDLWNLLGKFSYGDIGLKSNLTAVSCTMVMKDYRQAKKEYPQLIEPEAICTSSCLQWPSDLDDDSDRPAEIVMVVDRHACFQELSGRVWGGSSKQPGVGGLKQIKNVVYRDRVPIEISIIDRAPFEATEMIAWLVNNRHNIQSRMRRWDFATIIAMKHYMKTYDYAALTETYCVA
ncbi:MAG: hypothetical protein JNN16_12575 [Nitrospira sp.]|nr:hypothetical protein [Nitrospira sp.]